MNDMDLGIILGTTLWDDDLEDIYPREALLEAGLWEEPLAPQAPRRSRKIPSGSPWDRRLQGFFDRKGFDIKVKAPRHRFYSQP